MANLTRYPIEKINADNFGVFEHFEQAIDTTNKWTLTATDSGTGTIGTTTGGIIPLQPSDGTVADNDEIYLLSKLACFKPLANAPIYAEARLQFTEANTDDANVFFGLGSTVAANFLVDDGGGPRTSGAVIGIYKVDGETVWTCVARNGSTVTTTKSTTPAGGSAYQKLSVEIHDVISGSATVTYRVNGDTMRDSNGYIIKHYLPLSGIAACMVTVGVKNGGANQETVNVDYLGCWQVDPL